MLEHIRNIHGEARHRCACGEVFRQKFGLKKHWKNCPYKGQTTDEVKGRSGNKERASLEVDSVEGPRVDGPHIERAHVDRPHAETPHMERPIFETANMGTANIGAVNVEAASIEPIDLKL